MLSIHGTDDPLVPYNQSVILDQALREAGCNSTLITVKGGGHGGFNNPEINERLAVFFSISLALSVAAASTQGKKQDNQGKLAGS